MYGEMLLFRVIQSQERTLHYLVHCFETWINKMRFKKLFVKQMSFVLRAARKNHVTICSSKCHFTSCRRPQGWKFHYRNFKTERSLAVPGPSFKYRINLHVKHRYGDGAQSRCATHKVTKSRSMASWGFGLRVHHDLKKRQTRKAAEKKDVSGSHTYL